MNEALFAFILLLSFGEAILYILFLAFCCEPSVEVFGFQGAVVHFAGAHDGDLGDVLDRRDAQ